MDDPRLPLRFIPGKKESDYKNRKAYLNARAKEAGYRNYAGWLKARRAASVEPKNTSRKGQGKRREKILEDRRDGTQSKNVVWSLTNRTYEASIRDIDDYVRGLKDSTLLRIFMKANVSRTTGSPTLSDHDDRVGTWPWVSTGWMDVETLRDYLADGESVVDWMRTGYGVEDIVKKNGELKRYGVSAFHLLTTDH